MNKKKLNKLIKKIFLNHGLSNKHALIASKSLIKAELVGAPSHGLARLKMYCDRLKRKIINPKPEIKIKKNFTIHYSYRREQCYRFCCS